MAEGGSGDSRAVYIEHDDEEGDEPVLVVGPHPPDAEGASPSWHAIPLAVVRAVLERGGVLKDRSQTKRGTMTDEERRRILWDDMLEPDRVLFQRDEMLEAMETAHRNAGAVAKKALGLMALMAEEAEVWEGHTNTMATAIEKLLAVAEDRHPSGDWAADALAEAHKVLEAHKDRSAKHSTPEGP
jgi:hypothetical protein